MPEKTPAPARISPEDLAKLDAEESLALAAAADPWIDLSKLGSEEEILMGHLADRFAEASEAYVAAIGSNPEALQAAIRFLARQLARAQADVFALKSAVLGRDRLLLTRNWEYRDPLEAHSRHLLQDGVKAMWRQLGRYDLPLDAELIGFGWHAPEGNDKSSWRWTGPGLNSILLVPRFFEGRVVMRLTFRMLQEDVMPATGGLLVGGAEIPYELILNDRNPLNGKVEFELDLSSGDRGGSAFLPVEIRLNATWSPHEVMGTSDKRQLGLCLQQASLFAVA